jgi:hypothetical protein
MEVFRIESPFEKQCFIKAQFIRWEIHWRKNRRQLINYSIGTIIILSIGIVTRTNKEPTNPFLLLGIGFSVAILFFIYLRIFSKQRYSHKIKEIAERFDSLKMDCIYEFSNESIKYWDKEKNLEFNWSVFTYYSIYKGYLVLALDNSLIESYLFEKKESQSDEYEKVLEYVKSKLEYKEIK